MLCTCIYFADIGSFDGEEMPETPHDPSVDPDDDQDMADAEDHHQDVDAERHAPHADARYCLFLGAFDLILDTRWSWVTNSVH